MIAKRNKMMFTIIKYDKQSIENNKLSKQKLTSLRKNVAATMYLIVHQITNISAKIIIKVSFKGIIRAY